MNERLYRTVDDRVLAGVCGGLAVRFALDPSLVRVGFAVIALLTGIFPLLVVYVIMAAVVPEEPTGFAGRSPTPPRSDAVPGWMPPAGGDAAWTADAGTDPAWSPAPQTDATVPTSEIQAAGTGASSTGPAWTAQPDASGGRRANSSAGRMPAILGGLVLVGLGIYFLVRDRLDIDWGVVWAAGLVTVGVVIVIAAFRPRR